MQHHTVSPPVMKLVFAVLLGSKKPSVLSCSCRLLLKPLLPVY